MLLLLPTLLPLLLSGCTTEMDCELSGDCVGGVCHCDVGWKGVTCSELDLVSMIYIYLVYTFEEVQTLLAASYWQQATKRDILLEASAQLWLRWST